MPTIHIDEEIRQRAYAHWEAEGRPNGRALEHWLKAEAELKTASGTPGRAARKAGATKAKRTTRAKPRARKAKAS